MYHSRIVLRRAKHFGPGQLNKKMMLNKHSRTGLRWSLLLQSLSASTLVNASEVSDIISLEWTLSHGGVSTWAQCRAIPKSVRDGPREKRSPQQIMHSPATMIQGDIRFVCYLHPSLCIKTMKQKKLQGFEPTAHSLSTKQNHPKGRAKADHDCFREKNVIKEIFAVPSAGK